MCSPEVTRKKSSKSKMSRPEAQPALESGPLNARETPEGIYTDIHHYHSLTLTQHGQTVRHISIYWLIMLDSTYYRTVRLVIMV